MALPNSDNPVPPMSAETATLYVQRMVEREKPKAGNAEAALQQIARRYKLGFWHLTHLFKGKAKTLDTVKFARLRAAYLDYCAREIAALEHELAVERAVTGDDYLEDLVTEAAALAEKVAAKRAALDPRGSLT